MRLSIIVVNYNGGNLVNECLKSAFGQRSSFDYEVIVVDNASSDGGRESIPLQFPKVRLIANKNNLGFSRANNQAIRQSSSPYILLLNNDAYLKEEDFLEKACAFMEKRKDCAAIGPEIISPEGKIQNPYYRSFPNIATEFLSLSGFISLYNSINRDEYFYTREGLAHDKKKSNEMIVSHLCGACMLLRRRALGDAGLFDEDMFFYREDMDLSYRLKKKGWKIFVLPYITAIHIGAGSYGKAPFPIGREATKSIYIFFKKNYGRAQYLSLRLIHLASASLKILVYSILQLLGKSHAKGLSYYQDLFRDSLIGIDR